MRALLVGLLLLTACNKAEAAGPSTSDVLQAEHEMATTLRSFGKFGYPEPDRADRGEQPVAISNLKCADGKCSYDLVVASTSGRRTIHRPSVLFCQDPQSHNAWVSCVS
jgi:hypothetical protein